MTTLYLDPGHNPGDHRIFASLGERASVQVPVTTLDEFLGAEFPPVDLIKMDIQGAEMAALRGMRETIMKSKELVLVTEFWPEGMKRFGFSPAAFLHQLTEHRFRLHIIADTSGTLQDVEPNVILNRCHEETYLVCIKGAHSALLAQTTQS
jgi:hypothetical protein